jgi:hypothetical protein
MCLTTSEDWQVLVDHIAMRAGEMLGPPWRDECIACFMPTDFSDVWFVTRSGRLCGDCMERVLGESYPAPR